MTLEGWQEQLRRGGLDLAILLAVARGPRYGLEIIRHLEEFTDLVITEGTVYPILGRLTAEGVLPGFSCPVADLFRLPAEPAKVG